MKLPSYSFSLTPKQPEPEALHEYSYNEFWIDLPGHWRQVPTTEERTINFYSDQSKAAITISAEFYETPNEKAQGLAEVCLKSRIEALERLFPGQVEVLQRSIAPHSGGTGLELCLAADTPGKQVYLYLGYVTTRKVLNFTLVCPPGKEAAAKLFNATIANYRPKLP